MPSRIRSLFALVAVVAALALIAADAQARAGGGFSSGSRGMRTFSAPPPTRTAPNTAAPIERSMTQPGKPASTAAPAAPLGGGFFSRPGLLGGLAAGFLGAGLFGLLFGHGLFGGMGGLASVIGLLLQVVLVIFVARLVFLWWQRRAVPAYAGAMPRQMAADYGSSGAVGADPAGGEPAAIVKADYDAFERLLGDIQSAYGREDLNALRAHVTPEMLSYFSEELARHASRGLVNEITDVKLLQGDLAEAWREGSTDYASVAMRFSLIDRMVERASARLVEGSASPVEVTELWTFMRASGGDWLLSAIQQS